MSTFIRWLRFNLVGAMGMAMQLIALAVLNAWDPRHYLYATAVAIELTLVHNFIWHLHYTWRDRCLRSEALGQFVRFHLSNGLVSMLGNLVLMRLLVQGLRMHVLAANSICILCCSIVNFLLGEHWAFAARTQTA